jgi:ABC-type polysaccharide/polyol phosphate export permease
LLKIARYRDLIRCLVIRDLKVRYRRSTFGLAWSMGQPLLMMSVMAMVFSTIFRFDIPNYPVYVLSGILFWNFFSQSITASMLSLRSNAGIIQKVPVPREIFPLVTVLAGIVNLVLALVPLLFIAMVTGNSLSPALLFLPVSILLLATFTLGMGFLLSPLAVFFGDVIEVIGIVLATCMYLTPILYPLSIIPDHLRWIVIYNPLRSLLEVFRDPIFYGKVPPLSHLLVATAVAGTSLVVGWAAFRRNSDKIPFYL